MKQLLGSLIVSATAGMVLTSALVVAQAPPSEPAAATVTITTKVEEKAVRKEDQRVDAPVRKAMVKLAVPQKAMGMARPANLENLAQQYMRQARPIVRAELIFVRKVCELDMEHFRRINHDALVAVKDAAKTFVEAQQQGKARVPGRAQRPPTVDGFTLLREGLHSVMKKDLSPEQFARYQAEVDKRDRHRKQSAVCFLVDAIDRDLFLSNSQRLKLTESISFHWEEAWSMSLEYLLYGNQFYPLGIDAFVTPVLDPAQRKIWQGAQKMGGIGGIGGVFGGIMNDNDALEVELGESRKPDPAKVAPIRRLEMRKK